MRDLSQLDNNGVETSTPGWSYTNGRPKNTSGSLATDGFNWEKEAIAEIVASIYGVLNAGGVTLNGNPDTPDDSQLVSAINALIAAQVPPSTVLELTQIETCHVGELVSINDNELIKDRTTGVRMRPLADTRIDSCNIWIMNNTSSHTATFKVGIYEGSMYDSINPLTSIESVSISPGGFVFQEIGATFASELLLEAGETYYAAISQTSADHTDVRIAGVNAGDGVGASCFESTAIIGNTIPARTDSIETDYRPYMHFFKA